MATKEFWPCGKGNIKVVVKTQYEVTSKDFPNNLDPNIQWLCNFKVTEPGKEHGEKVPDKYEILAPWKDRKLVYSDNGSVIYFGPENDLCDKWINKKKYKSAKLDLADPPVGWD